MCIYVVIIICTYVCPCLGESNEDRIKRLKAIVAAKKGKHVRMYNMCIYVAS